MEVCLKGKCYIGKCKDLGLGMAKIMRVWFLGKGKGKDSKGMAKYMQVQFLGKG